MKMRNVGAVGHFFPHGAITERGGQDVGPYPLVLLTQKILYSRSRRSGACPGKENGSCYVTATDFDRFGCLAPGFDAAFEISATHLRRDYHEVCQCHGYLSIVCGSSHQINDYIVVRLCQVTHQSTHAAFTRRDRNLDML